MTTTIKMSLERAAAQLGERNASGSNSPMKGATASSPASTLRLSVTVNEACRALGIGRTSLYDLIASKKLKSAVVAGRRVIPVAELERLLCDCIEV